MGTVFPRVTSPPVFVRTSFWVLSIYRNFKRVNLCALPKELLPGPTFSFNDLNYFSDAVINLQNLISGRGNEMFKKNLFPSFFFPLVSPVA